MWNLVKSNLKCSPVKHKIPVTGNSKRSDSHINTSKERERERERERGVRLSWFLNLDSVIIWH